MLDNLCLIFMTGYFQWGNGKYSPVPENTKRIEIKTEKFRTLLFKITEDKWFGNVNGKIFYSTLSNYRRQLCSLADAQTLPETAYKKRSIFKE